MRLKKCIKNIKIVTEDLITYGGIGIDEGIIQTIFSQDNCPQAEEIIDGQGLTLLPGGIDPHVHFREPSPNEREDFQTGTKSAAAGGITCIIDQPIDIPPVLDIESFNNKLEEVKPKAYTDFALWGGITKDNIENIKSLIEIGAAAFKAFLCSSDPNYPKIDDGTLYAVLKKLSGEERIIALHAENEDIINYNENKNLPHHLRRPEISEVEAISRALLLAEKTNANLHILHASSAEGIKLIKNAKNKGVQVTVETCPHYLTLTKQAVENSDNNYALCNPLISTKENLEKLWDYIKSDTIDCIVSDHSPYTYKEKEKGYPGITGVQTSLPLMLSEGYHKRDLDLQKIVSLMSTNIAKLFGLYPKKGTISVGSDADFILVDEDKKWQIKKENLYFKNKWSPFIGKEMKGKVIQTWVRGECIYDEKKGFPQGPGYGKFHKIET